MKKLYTIKTSAFIAPLNMCGPVTTPVKIEESIVVGLVKKGWEIYEHNPVYPKEKVLLTPTRCRGIHFKVTRKMAALQGLQNKTTSKTLITPKNKKYSEKEEKEKTPEPVKEEKPVDDVVVVKKKSEKPKETPSVRPDDFTKM